MSESMPVRHQRSAVQRWSRCLSRALWLEPRPAPVASHCSCPPAYHEYGVHGPRYVVDATTRRAR